MFVRQEKRNQYRTNRACAESELLCSVQPRTPQRTRHECPGFGSGEKQKKPMQGRRMMARPPCGQVLDREGKRGKTFAIRFRAYGTRQYVTLGTADEGWTHATAEQELANVLADVRRGIWRPAEPRVTSRAARRGTQLPPVRVPVAGGPSARGQAPDRGGAGVGFERSSAPALPTPSAIRHHDHRGRPLPDGQGRGERRSRARRERGERCPRPLPHGRSTRRSPCWRRSWTPR